MRKVTRLIIHLAAVLILMAAITMACLRIQHVNAATTGFLFLVAILMIATVWGLVEATVGSMVAMLCFNYFFLPPVGTLMVTDPQNWVALFAFLATSLTASQLSARLKGQRREALDRKLEVEQLYALSRGLLLTDSTLPVGSQIAQRVAESFAIPAVALYGGEGDDIYYGGAEPIPEATAKLRDAAQRITFLKEKGVIVASVTFGGTPVGSLAIRGISLSDAALRSLLNLVAIGWERARTQTLVNRAELARQSQELKSTLLDAIAHEFKTPLTSIKAVTTDLLDPSNGLPPQQRELAAIADEGADRLERLVTEAIQLARIEGGTFPLNREVHFPGSLISAAMRQMKSLTGRREIHVEIAQETCAVWADGELIEMVIRQLIDNALKYSPAGSPIVIRSASAKGTVRFSVADQGAGIAASEQAQLFERFYRSTREHPQVKGAGMGLTIAREILRAHGGEIWVNSSPGEGSEFSFSLPAAGKEKMA